MGLKKGVEHSGVGRPLTDREITAVLDKLPPHLVGLREFWNRVPEDWLGKRVTNRLRQRAKSPGIVVPDSNAVKSLTRGLPSELGIESLRMMFRTTPDTPKTGMTPGGVPFVEPVWTPVEGLDGWEQAVIKSPSNLHISYRAGKTTDRLGDLAHSVWGSVDYTIKPEDSKYEGVSLWLGTHSDLGIPYGEFRVNNSLSWWTEGVRPEVQATLQNKLNPGRESNQRTDIELVL